MQYKNNLSKLFLAILMALFVTGAQFQAHSLAAPVTSSASDQSSQAKVLETYGKLSLSFEANQGQTEGQVEFLSRGSGYNLFLTATEAILALSKPATPATVDAEETQATEHAVLRMELVGANPQPQMAGLEELPGKVNYFMGNDPTKWRTNVPTYARVEYQDVYPGVDLVYYGNQRQLEYDFVVAAGADPSAITLGFQGSDSLEIDAGGNLVLLTEGGQVILRAPIIYQEINETRQSVAGGYVLKDRQQVGFEVAGYDAKRALVIDPVLVYSTYLGGGGTDWGGSGIAVDTAGNAYITGLTDSTNFPTASAIYGSNSGGYDAFVTKIDASGSSLVYSTYLGGSAGDYGYDIAIDPAGNVYLTGMTWSTDFPTASPIYGSSSGNLDAFVTKIDASGSSLVYSTYLGGSDHDCGRGIAVDATGNAYIAGYAVSKDFPIASAIFPTHGYLAYDGFVTKIDASGSSLVYSTYLGGYSSDQCYDIAVDSTENVYVAGYTLSTDFPTASAIYGSNSGSNDAFVTKIDASGSSLVYSTYLGGTGSDRGYGIAVDNAGNAYITGVTTSGDFPTASAIYGSNSGSDDAFVTKIDASGSGLVYSTYLGGGGQDVARRICVDSQENAYVTGETQAGFPLASPIDATYDGGRDAFVTEIDTSGSLLVYSTYLGGNGYDYGSDIAVDSEGNAYVTGRTNSTDFPTASPIYGSISGDYDAFVTKIGPGIVNAAPVAVNDAYSMDEDNMLTVAAPGVLGNDTDADADPLTAVWVSGPSNGTLTLNADGSFSYTPNADFNGTDSFTYRAYDGTDYSNVATVNITIIPVNDAPVANDQSVTTDEDTPLDITLTASDVDNDTLTYTIVSQPQHGTLSGTAPDVTYTPDPNYNGSDSFTYKANDGDLDSNVATVTITVNPVNDAPVAVDDTATTQEDTPVIIAVLANDSDLDADALAVESVTQPASGSVTNNGTDVTYSPDADFCGNDSFTYTVSDGNGGTDTATVNVTVACVNDPPVAVDDAYSVDEDDTLTVAAPGVLGNDSDVEGNALTAVLVTGPSDGTLTLNADGSFTYAPDANFNGTDTFTYKANDGATDSNIATVTIAVNSVNDAPVAVDDTASTDENTAVTIDVLANDSDVDGDELTVESVTQGTNGTVTINPAGTVKYVPNTGFSGIDSFTYKANDGTADSNEATVTVTVIPANTPPTADAGGPYSVDEGGSVPVNASGSDPENDPLTFAWDLDKDGTFETPGQSVTFSAAGLDGPSSHTIAVQVTDSGGLSDTDQTTVEVLNVAPTAIFANTSGAVNEGETATLAFSNQFDPSAADAAAGFLYSYDCTDDGTFELSDDPAASFVCHYPDNSTFTARGRIKDKDGGFTDYTVEVTVNNIAPTVGEIFAPLDPVQVNTEIGVSADFTDPGVLDTHTAVWDWGDGSQCNTATDPDCSLTESSGSGSVTGSHTYTAAGVYTVKLTVMDDDDGSGQSEFRYVVVYDPEGGFVTGGGWIWSEAGFCKLTTECESAEGKANFGFVSKYKKGADIPTGETEFQFKAGNLNFHSDSYEWLVVANHKAMYKGVGTINGVGNYGFMLSAIDEKLTPSTDVDLFRIKIWDKDNGDAIVYDNQMGAEDDADPTTEIGGGNIVIHK